MTPEPLAEPVQVYLQITEKNGNPAIEIRKLLSDPIALRTIITAANYNQPVAVYPVFRDRVKALNNLQEIGIISIGEDGNYHFNI